MYVKQSQTITLAACVASEISNEIINQREKLRDYRKLFSIR